MDENDIPYFESPIYFSWGAVKNIKDQNRQGKVIKPIETLVK
jgi:hypothetical protein